MASYYRLAKTVEDDPEFDIKKAQKLRRFVEGHDHAIRLKAEIMVDHFHQQVIAKTKIGGAARAMVVTNGIERAIQYFHAIRDYLRDRKSQYRAVVAFSGEPEFGGQNVTEASLNGFSSAQIAQKIQEDPYRFLVCADKFQTGYDEPLLHTMYVDKTLSGIKAVQTLSRLNRAHPKKHDVFVLDFVNDADTIRDAFADYYRATILAGETDPDKLHDLQADLDAAQVYLPEQIDDLVGRYLDGADRDQLDPILDVCAAVYANELDEDAQVDFKGKAKAFVRTYAFLSSVLPYTNAAWEKRSIFLNFLISKLPAPAEEDLSKGILDAIDMDSYRVEKRAVQQIVLPDETGELDPVPPSGGGHLPEPELERLSSILREFNDLFGDIAWQDNDRVKAMITETIPFRVAQDAAFKNARRNSDDANARIEHAKALTRVMTALIKDDAELFKQFMDNDSFKRWMTDTVFRLASNPTKPVDRRGTVDPSACFLVFFSSLVALLVCTASGTASRTCSTGVVSAQIGVHLHPKTSINTVFIADLGDLRVGFIPARAGDSTFACISAAISRVRPRLRGPNGRSLDTVAEPRSASPEPDSSATWPLGAASSSGCSRTASPSGGDQGEGR